MFDSKGDIRVYDFENDEWSEKTCKATENLLSFSCVKIPKLPKSSLDQNPPDIDEPEFEIHPIC